MAYKTHRLKIDLEKDEGRLDDFLNGLGGDVVSIVPIIKRLSLAQIYGASPRVVGVLVVEKI
jgi:hypothetical protein